MDIHYNKLIEHEDHILSLLPLIEKIKCYSTYFIIFFFFFSLLKKDGIRSEIERIEKKEKPFLYNNQMKQH